jgi:hypothetical protein
MTSKKPNPKRVLSIDPTSKGFGFVVLESPTTLVDWAIKAVRGQDEAKTLTKVLELIRHYRPEVMVLEDHKGSRRHPRVRSLLDAVCRLATTESLKIRCVPVSRVKKVFRTFHAKTKYEIAHVVARQLPVLAPQLPPYRKAWMSEDFRMPIFDAAAFALTYFLSRGMGNRNAAKPLPPEAESSAI